MKIVRESETTDEKGNVTPNNQIKTESWKEKKKRKKACEERCYLFRLQTNTLQHFLHHSRSVQANNTVPFLISPLIRSL